MGAASVTLSSIQVSPTNPSIAFGTTAQFTATGIYSDSTSQDLTSSVTWSSSSTAIAAISNAPGSNGLATSVAAGSTTITATLGVTSGTSTLTVGSAAITLDSIQISPTNPSIALGTTRQFTATGIYSDNSSQDLTASVTWNSSIPTAAAVSNVPGSIGLATSVAAGSTTITATFDGVSGNTDLTVTAATLSSIQVSPTNPIIARGMPQQFTAIGVYSDGTSQDLTAQVTWSSSDTTIAAISNSAGFNGLATTILAGTATIQATLVTPSGPVSGSTTITVTGATLQSIDVTQALPFIALGTDMQFIATGTFSDSTTEDLTALVTWSSSSTAIAEISNAPGSNGVATSLSAGLATITATLNGISGSTELTVTSATLSSIEVTPTDPSISSETTEQFYASGTYSDGSVQDITALVTWSSDTTVATVSNAAGSNGLAIPVASGTTTITAQFEGITGTSTLTVTPATLVSIAITPATPQIAAGTTQQFVATGNFNNATTQDITASVVWTSSNTNIVTISNTGGTNGLATAVGTGTVTITAALGSVTNSTTLTVNPVTLSSIVVSSGTGSTTISLGSPVQFTATALFSDSSTQDVTNQATWKSSAKTVAVVSNTRGSKGLVTPISGGGSTISATLTLGGITKTGSLAITVSTSTLTSIVVTPLNPSVNLTAKTQQFTATGHYADGSTQDLTKSTSLTWTSSNTAIATIANTPKPKKGLATFVSKGSTTISAKMKGLITPGTTTLTVN